MDELIDIEYDSIQKRTISECKNTIESILNNCISVARAGETIGNIDIVVVAYLLGKSCDKNTAENEQIEYDKDIENDVLQYAQRRGILEAWSQFEEIKYRYNKTIFYSMIKLINNTQLDETPYGIKKVAEKILDFREKDCFVDLCCGTGGVISDYVKEIPSLNAYGFEIRENLIMLAKIFNDIWETNIHYECKEVFELAGLMHEKYDKVFANYPFGIRLKDLHTNSTYLNEVTRCIPEISKATSGDWIFNMLMMDLLSKEGKAVGVMTNGSTWNISDSPIRKYFVENGFVESVISLPPKLFSITTIPTSLVVLSHNNQQGVRLVDASEIYVPGRRVNEITDELVEKILTTMNSDNENSIFVDSKTLKENDYVLNISRYKKNDEEIEDGKPLGDVVKRITRGATLTAKALDHLSSSDPTNMQYLMLANIQNGIIDNELPYLNSIDKRNEKYCVSDRCVILSKNGFPYKVAVAEVEEGKTILGNGNMYIIELDEEQIDPYYLAAFLGSRKGMEALKRITVGATIPNIGVEQLKNMVIPVPELREQKKVSEKYRKIKKEIASLQCKLEEAKLRMVNVFEEK